MYMLSTGRQFQDTLLYEVVEFSIENPDIIIIHTMKKEQLHSLTGCDECDFWIENGVVRSTAPITDGGFAQGFSVKFEPSIYSLLQELVGSSSYFITPENLIKYQENNGELNAIPFYNLKTSSNCLSSYFELENNEFYPIIYTADDKLVSNSFCVAISAQEAINSDNLIKVGKCKINNVSCKLYKYEPFLKCYPHTDNINYIPFPLYNYLNLGTAQCVSLLNYIADLDTHSLDRSKQSVACDLSSIVVSVEASVELSDAEQRRFIYKMAKNTESLPEDISILDEFALQELQRLGLTVEDPDVRFELKVATKRKKVKFELALLQYRALLCKYLQNTNKIVSIGGGGGDTFRTTITFEMGVLV